MSEKLVLQCALWCCDRFKGEPFPIKKAEKISVEKNHQSIVKSKCRTNPTRSKCSDEKWEVMITVYIDSNYDRFKLISGFGNN